VTTSRLTLLVALAWIGGQPALAQNELTPFVGYRFGGQFDTVTSAARAEAQPAADYGLVFDRELGGEGGWFEAYWSRQTTEIVPRGIDAGEPFDVTVDYLHVGGMYQPGTEQLRPFVLATVGLTLMDPEPSGFNKVVGFSVAVGGGVKVMFSERVGLRAEGRFVATLGGGSVAVACGPGCSVSLSTTGIWQTEINLGLVISF
jgi:hypothetical protein